MAIKINFRNGTYTQDDFIKEFRAIVGNNIVITKDMPNSLKVTQNTTLGLSVLVSSGSAFVNGEFVVSDTNVVVNIEKNLSGSTRKDIIVFDLSSSSFKAVRGTTTAPNPTSTQLLLAEVIVKNNSFSIVNADIIDKRVIKLSATNNDDYEILEYREYPNYQRIKKYRDGRLEIFIRKYFEGSIRTQWSGGCGYTMISDALYMDNFKLHFISTPEVKSLSAIGSSDGYAISVFSHNAPTASKPCSIQLWRPSPTDRSIVVGATAEYIGRWK